jgi:hypothetical protein
MPNGKHSFNPKPDADLTSPPKHKRTDPIVDPQHSRKVPLRKRKDPHLNKMATAMNPLLSIWDYSLKEKKTLKKAKQDAVVIASDSSAIPQPPPCDAPLPVPVQIDPKDLVIIKLKHDLFTMQEHVTQANKDVGNLRAELEQVKAELAQAREALSLPEMTSDVDLLGVPNSFLPTYAGERMQTSTSGTLLGLSPLSSPFNSPNRAKPVTRAASGTLSAKRKQFSLT